MKGRRRKHRHGRRAREACRNECPSVSLDTVAVSQEAVITSFDALNGEAARLRDLGIREGSRVRIILSTANQMIVGVDQARVGLPKTLAGQVLVRKVNAA